MPNLLAEKLPFDLPWKKKVEVGVNAEPELIQTMAEEHRSQQASVHALHEVVTLNTLQIKMNIHRRTNHLPKVSFKNMKSADDKEWLMFYLTLSNTGTAGADPIARPTFTLVNPLGDEFPEDPQFMKKANSEGQLQARSVLESGQSGSTNVGFHVPRGQPYALRISEPGKTKTGETDHLYFSLQGED